jgi:hypothetical protein
MGQSIPLHLYLYSEIHLQQLAAIWRVCPRLLNNIGARVLAGMYLQIPVPVNWH